MPELQPYSLPDADLIESTGNVWKIWIPDKIYLILGLSNKAENSLLTEKFPDQSYTVMRRPSGGEAVVLTTKTIVISVSFYEKKLRNPKVYFHEINKAIIHVLENFQVKDLAQKGISDIAIGQKKILGSSIYRKNGRVLYHAVLNIAEEISTISQYLKHPSKEPDYRMGRNHRDFVTSLHEQGYKIEINHLQRQLKQELSNFDFDIF